MKKLLPTLRLSLDMTNVLAKIEHAGIKINLKKEKNLNYLHFQNKLDWDFHFGYQKEQN